MFIFSQHPSFFSSSHFPLQVHISFITISLCSLFISVSLIFIFYLLIPLYFLSLTSLFFYHLYLSFVCSSIYLRLPLISVYSSTFIIYHLIFFVVPFLNSFLLLPISLLFSYISVFSSLSSFAFIFVCSSCFYILSSYTFVKPLFKFLSFFNPLCPPLIYSSRLTSRLRLSFLPSFSPSMAALSLYFV